MSTLRAALTAWQLYSGRTPSHVRATRGVLGSGQCRSCSRITRSQTLSCFLLHCILLVFSIGVEPQYRDEHDSSQASENSDSGDDWAEEFAARTKNNLDGPAAADPQITVDALLQALLRPDPPTRMATGAAAHILWKPLSKLPDKTRDVVLHKLLFTGPPPAALS